jgi:hypothetical protein
VSSVNANYTARKRCCSGTDLTKVNGPHKQTKATEYSDMAVYVSFLTEAAVSYATCLFAVDDLLTAVLVSCYPYIVANVY